MSLGKTTEDTTFSPLNIHTPSSNHSILILIAVSISLPPWCSGKSNVECRMMFHVFFPIFRAKYSVRQSPTQSRVVFILAPYCTRHAGSFFFNFCHCFSTLYRSTLCVDCLLWKLKVSWRVSTNAIVCKSTEDPWGERNT
jgi:hypothetical protein